MYLLPQCSRSMLITDACCSATGLATVPTVHVSCKKNFLNINNQLQDRFMRCIMNPLYSASFCPFIQHYSMWLCATLHNDTAKMFKVMCM